jgi:hypothetical protein
MPEIATGNSFERLTELNREHKQVSDVVDDIRIANWNDDNNSNNNMNNKYAYQ